MAAGSRDRGSAANPDDHEDWPLVDALRSGDRGAARELLRKHEGLLRKFCLRYRSGTVDQDDLMQEARIGFLKGLTLAERGRGSSPISYAVYWIRNYVRRYYQNHSRDVRVPVAVQEGRLSGGDGVKLLRPASMDQPLGAEGDLTYADVLAAPSSALDDDDVVDAARVEVLREEVRRLVGELPAREADVVRSRFLADEPETLERRRRPAVRVPRARAPDRITA